ncbi:MAG: hypothetical protein AAFY43_11610 [Pseudomonadota bacterium]
MAQRLVAQLQDAGVERVVDVNVYLSVVDRHGAQRHLLLDGAEVDLLDIPADDLAVAAPAKRLALSRAGSRPTAGPKRYKGQRR